MCIRDRFWDCPVDLNIWWRKQFMHETVHCTIGSLCSDLQTNGTARLTSLAYSHYLQWLHLQWFRSGDPEPWKQLLLVPKTEPQQFAGEMFHVPQKRHRQKNDRMFSWIGLLGLKSNSEYPRQWALRVDNVITPCENEVKWHLCEQESACERQSENIIEMQ